MRRVYAEVYGCTANMADGEIALGLLRRAGWELVERPEEADVILLVTCAVKKPTSDRMLHRIRKLRGYGKRLIVAGCMAPGEYVNVRRAAPDSILLHPRSIGWVVEAAELGTDFMDADGVEKLGYPRLLRNPVIGIVPVSEGCRWRRCGFCIVPRTRGEFVSYSTERIVEEVERLLGEGVREIWLTSQDMGGYGLDKGKNMLPELIKRVAEIPGLFWIRIGMMNPIYLKPILPNLAETYLHPKIYRFLHLPVQSGSDKILRAMNRGYTVSLFREIVDYMRERVPGLTLATDVIVGYPGEEEGDFEDTVKLIEEVKPDAVNVSKFFPRPGTPAEKLPRLDTRVIKRRSKLVSEIARKIAYERNLNWVGWRGLALVDELGERGEAIARNQSYKPIVLRGCGREVLGKLVEVEVVEARPYCLMGRLVREVIPR